MSFFIKWQIITVHLLHPEITSIKYQLIVSNLILGSILGSGALRIDQTALSHVYLYIKMAKLSNFYIININCSDYYCLYSFN